MHKVFAFSYLEGDSEVWHFGRRIVYEDEKAKLFGRM